MYLVHADVYSAVLSLEVSPELHWAFTMLCLTLFPIRCHMGRLRSLRPFLTLLLFLFAGIRYMDNTQKMSCDVLCVLSL